MKHVAHYFWRRQPQKLIGSHLYIFHYQEGAAGHIFSCVVLAKLLLFLSITNTLWRSSVLRFFMYFKQNPHMYSLSHWLNSSG